MKMIKGNTGLTAALIAGLLASAGGLIRGSGSQRERKTRTPMMVTSSREEIAAWNDRINERTKQARAGVREERDYRIAMLGRRRGIARFKADRLLARLA